MYFKLRAMRRAYVFVFENIFLRFPRKCWNVDPPYAGGTPPTGSAPFCFWDHFGTRNVRKPYKTSGFWIIADPPYASWTPPTGFASFCFWDQAGPIR